jgi:virginiamycin B lyase
VRGAGTGVQAGTDPEPASTPAPFTTPSVAPTETPALAPTPSANLWFTEDRGARVGRVTTGGLVTELTLPGQAAGGTTQALGAGPDGAVWVVGAPVRVDLSTPIDRLYRVAPDGTIAEHRLPGSATAIAAGAPGTLWVAGQGQVWKVEL